MICPKCQDLMRTITRGAVHIEQCDNCKGVFLDGGELEQIIAAEHAHYAQPAAPYAPPVAEPGSPPYAPPAAEPGAPQPYAPPAAESGAPPPYQPPPASPSTPHTGPHAVPHTGPHEPAHPGSPPPYQPPPGTGTYPQPYPPQSYPQQPYPPHRRRRSFLEELFD
ncbi:zf-TFIIB domain-containing protein [Saccharothrix sp. SC076]|nr:zf-TFIIB domain-containing protein [Saccharothrix obliqua]